ncbi:unnamed protein product [Amoebophrya sp. A25]|nr:unnamed protein product [Amoebophrya sp. A25]|eukprot:GSA25T00001915001.1
MVQLGKAYLRYEAAGQFGTIQSPNCNLVLSGCGKYVFTCCNEAVACWSLKRNECLFHFDASTSDDVKLLVPVTQLGWLRVGSTMAVGYADGTVRLWEFSTNTPQGAALRDYDVFDLKPPKLKVTFHGHKNHVSCLGFCKNAARSSTEPATRQGNKILPSTLGASPSNSISSDMQLSSGSTSVQGSSLLASGGYDTDIVIWDAVGESGVCRLRGHRDRVTGVQILPDAERVLSVGKDRTIKLWSIATQVCLQTLAERVELWSVVALDADSIWGKANPNKAIENAGNKNGKASVNESESTEQRPPPCAIIVGASDHLLRVYVEDGSVANPMDRRFESAGSLQRTVQNAAATDLQLACDGKLLVCQSSAKTVEPFRVHDSRETDKKRKRRRKRAAEKLKKKGGAVSATEEAIQRAIENGAEVSKLVVSGDGTAYNNLAAGGAAGDAFYQPTDAFTRLPPHRVKAKLHGMAWAGNRCALGLNSNAIEILDEVEIPEGDEAPLEMRSSCSLAAEAEQESDTEDQGRLGNLGKSRAAAQQQSLQLLSIERPGHRNTIRAVAVSPDDMMILSLSAECIKLWSTQTRKCLQTIPSGYGTCGYFLPGNTHVVIGTKTGDVELYDLGTGTLVQCTPVTDALAGIADGAGDAAGKGQELYALVPTPDETGFCVGGADKTVTFFEWITVAATTGVDDGEGNAKKSKKGSKNKAAAGKKIGTDGGSEITGKTLRFRRAAERAPIELSDDVMAIAHSAEWIAVGMLDHNVSVYYADSLKHNLSLYGHKLPVLCLDISTDQQMVASGSADKTIKLWSTRFGNCLKSLRAHEDSVMCCKFVRETHYLVTCGKDKAVKTWDCDTYELISNLGYHQGEIWGMGLSYDGAFIVTGGADRALRVWRRTEQQFFTREEREKELEEQMEQDAVRNDFGAGNTVENLRPTRKNLEVIKTTDRLMDVIDRAEDNVKMGLDKTRQTCIVKSLNSLLPANIYEVLLALPFNYSLDVLETVSTLLEFVLHKKNTAKLAGIDASATSSERQMNNCPYSLITETTIRAALILIHVHARQLGQNAEYAEILMRLRDGIRQFVQRHIQNVGVNAAAMEFYLEDLKHRSTVLVDGEFRTTKKVSKKRAGLLPDATKSTSSSSSSSGTEKDRNNEDTIATNTTTLSADNDVEATPRTALLEVAETISESLQDDAAVSNKRPAGSEAELAGETSATKMTGEGRKKKRKVVKKSKA